MDPPAQITVTQLLARARSGEAECRDRLFHACRQYLDIVAGEVASWLRAKVDAADLVQETLLEAHRDFDRFQGQSTAEWLAWLRRIMAHNAADLVRRYGGTAKRRAGRERPLESPRHDTTAFPVYEPAAPGPTPSQEFLLRDTELRVAAALATMTDDHRQVIVLRNLERLPFDEVARRMNRTRPAAQMLWMRAVRKLQESLVE